MTPIATISIAFAAIRGIAAAAVVFSTTAMTATEASAYSLQVKLACASDYYSLCSQHALGSPAVRQCMRDSGPQLSKRCVGALIASGEVSQAEVDRRSASRSASLR